MEVDSGPDDYFGNPARITEYKILLYVGIAMLAAGGPFLFLAGKRYGGRRRS